jgi:hypothetical protein
VQIEPAVRGAVLDILKDAASLTRDLQGHDLPADSISALLSHSRRAAGDLETGQQDLTAILKRVDLRSDGLQVTICVSSDTSVQSNPPVLITRSIPMLMRRRGVEMRLVLEGESQPARIDDTLIRAVARARSWLADICSGRVRSHREIAAREGITAEYVNQLLPLGFLAPKIVEAIVNGRQPVHLSTHDLMTRLTLPADWAAQHRLLGMA